MKVAVADKVHWNSAPSARSKRSARWGVLRCVLVVAIAVAGSALPVPQVTEPAEAAVDYSNCYWGGPNGSGQGDLGYPDPFGTVEGNWTETSATEYFTGSWLYFEAGTYDWEGNGSGYHWPPGGSNGVILDVKLLNPDGSNATGGSFFNFPVWKGTTFDVDNSGAVGMAAGWYYLRLGVDHASDERSGSGSFRIQFVRRTGGSSTLPAASIKGTLGRHGAAGFIADPVNTATGNFVHSASDVPSAAPRMPVLTRTYNSLDQSRYPSAFGPGWTSPLDVAVFPLDNAAVPGSECGLELRLADGRQEVIAPKSGGGWEWPDTLMLADFTWSNPGYEAEFLNGASMRFGSAGGIDEIIDADGTSTLFCRTGTFVSSVRVNAADCSSAGVYQLDLTDSGSDGLVDELAMPGGSVVTYSYNGNGMLESASRPHLTSETDVGEEVYEYDNTRGPYQMDELKERVDTSTLRALVSQSFDTAGRVSEQVLVGGDHATFTYGAANYSTNTIQTVVSFCDDWNTGTSPAACNSSSPPVDETTTFVHGTDGRLKTITDDKGNPVERTWDRDLPASFTDRLAANTANTYDSIGQLTETDLPDPAGSGNAGSVSTVWCDTGDTFRPKQTTDAAGVVRQYWYDESSQCSGGRTPVKSGIWDAGTSSLVAVTTTDCDATAGLNCVTSDLPIQVIDADGVKIDRTWDTSRRLMLSETSYFDADGNPATAAVAATTYFGYDALGRRVVTRSPLGIESWIALDARGRVTTTYDPVAVTRASGSGAGQCEASMCHFPVTIDVSPAPAAVQSVYRLDGSIDTVTDELGGDTTYSTTYPGGGGRVETVTDPAGVTMTSTYDKADRLIETKVGDPGVGEEAVTTNVYGQLGELSYTLGPDTDPGVGETRLRTSFEYDDSGNLTRTILGDDPDTGVTEHHSTRTEYDARGRVTDEYGPAPDGTTGAPEQDHTSYAYDLADRLTTRVDHVDDAGATLTTYYFYDSVTGRLTYEIVDVAGDNTAVPDPADQQTENLDDQVTMTCYTAAGRVDKTLTKTGNTVTRAWDPGSCATPTTNVEVTDYIYDDAGHPAWVIDPRAFLQTTPKQYASQSIFDADGRLARTVNPLGYGAANPLNYATFYTYDAAGRTIAVSTPDEGSTWRTSRTAYDALGRVAWTGEGEATAATGTPAAPDVAAVLDDPAPPSARYFFYDGAGRMVRSVDPNGVISGTVVDYGFDSRGNRRTRKVGTFPTPADALDPLEVPTYDWEQSWSYDLADRLVEEVPLHATATTAAATTYAYDAEFGWLTDIAEYDAATPTPNVQRTETRTYWNNGLVRTRSYDDQTPNDLDYETEYTYDPAGRVLVVEDGNANTSTFTYDRRGNIASYDSPQTTGAITYTWDLTNRPLQVTYPDSAKFRYQHLAGGLLLKTDIWSGSAWVPLMRPTYTRDGLLLNERASDLTTNWRIWTPNARSGNNTRYQETTAFESTSPTDTAMEWNTQGRISKATDQIPVTDVPTSFGYDAAGQLCSVDVGAASPATCNPETPANTVEHYYNYGDRGERTEEIRGDGSTTVIDTYTWDNQARLDNIDDGTTQTDFEYDHQGRRTEQTNGTDTTTYTYDARGSLVTIELGGTTTRNETRAYDPFGHLTNLTINDGTTDTQDLELVWDPTKSPSQIIWGRDLLTSSTWTRASYGVRRIAQHFGGNNAFLSFDHLESVVESPGSPSAPDTYDPYGTPVDPPANAYFGYRGEVQTGELVHLRARDYDPTTGTFLQRDPLDGVSGSPTEANPYQYADNDALNRTDPTGMRTMHLDGNLKGAQLSPAASFVRSQSLLSQVYAPMQNPCTAGVGPTPDLATAQATYGARSGAFLKRMLAIHPFAEFGELEDGACYALPGSKSPAAPIDCGHPDPNDPEGCPFIGKKIMTQMERDVCTSITMIGHCYVFDTVKKEAYEAADRRFAGFKDQQDGGKYNAAVHMYTTSFSGLEQGLDYAEFFMNLHEWAQPNPFPHLNQMDLVNNYYAVRFVERELISRQMGRNEWFGGRELDSTRSSVEIDIADFIDDGQACEVHMDKNPFESGQYIYYRFVHPERCAV